MRRIAFVAALLPTAGLAAVVIAASALGSPPDDLQAAKAASARFHSIEQARAAGYVQASPCEQLTGVGAMGQHWVNPALIMDPAVDPLQPEVLLYAPKGNGKLELVGIEYLKVDADQDLSTDDDRPTLFGRAFDGPMEGHGPPGAMPRHYDLHVWLWQSNPAGLFAPWNPAVSC